MNTTKITGFIQGAFYPLVAVLLSYVIANLGASGIFPIGISTLITGCLSILENSIQKNTGRAMFGLASKTY